MNIQIDHSAFVLELRRLSNESDPITFAKGLTRGRRSGYSNRKLATMADCSEAHVRDMLKLLRLPSRDQGSIAAGAPYRPFLIKLKQFDEARKQKATLEVKTAGERAAEKGARALDEGCRMLSLSGGYAEQALGDARAHILRDEEGGALKNSDVLWRGVAEPVFAANVPAGYLEVGGVEVINAAVECIARSMVTLMPNFDARYHAFALALANPRLRAAW